MGIRYYAYPVDADLIEVAKSSPRSFLSDDPLMDAWGPLDERSPMLYLDKCFHELRVLLGGDSSSPNRPAFQLVEGDVVHVPEEWISHVAVLDPAQVVEIAQDLSVITPGQVRASLTATRTFGPRDDLDEEFHYVTQYLRDAVTFTTGLSERGDGLVYMIG
jgi:hypothetical protein